MNCWKDLGDQANHCACQVAEAIVEGMQEGKYLLPTPNAPANFFLNSCLVPCSKRPYPLLVDMLLAPVYVLVHWNLTRKAEAAAWMHSVFVGAKEKRRAVKRAQCLWGDIALGSFLMLWFATVLLIMGWVLRQ